MQPPNEDMERHSQRILVVDDDPKFRADLSFILAREGYSVATAASNAEMQMRLNRLLFDLVILDVRLDESKTWTSPSPDVADKQQLSRSLAEVNRYGDQTAVVILTGYATTELVAEAVSEYKELIGSGFLDKPVKRDKLLTKVKEGLERTDRLRSQHITNNPLRNPIVIVKNHFEPFAGKLSEPFVVILRELLYQDYFPLAPRIRRDLPTGDGLQVLCWSRKMDTALFVEIGDLQVGKSVEFLTDRGTWKLQFRDSHPFGTYKGILYAVENLTFEEFWTLSGGQQ